MLGNDAGRKNCGPYMKIFSLNSPPTLGRALLWLGHTVPTRGGRWSQSSNTRIGLWAAV